MKKILKNPIFMFILGVVLTSGIAVTASQIFASSISFTPSNPNWVLENNNVEEAIDDLYEKSSNNVTSKKFNFISSNSIQNFSFGFRPNYVACVGDFTTISNYYVNITYNKDLDEDYVVRSNGSSSEKMNLSTWFTLNDNGLTWNISGDSWNGINVYCFASK